MKRFKFVDWQEADACNYGGQFRWDLCIFCQTSRDERLQCPLDSKRTDVGAGYVSVATSLPQFKELNAFPPSIRVSDLDDGQGIEAALISHRAKWHKTCRNMYNNTKLDRLRKRKHDDCSRMIEAATESERDPSPESSVSLGHFTRSFSVTSSKSTWQCFLCDKSDDVGPLHTASTFDINIRVRHCAEVLQDSQLLAMISSGDLMSQEVKYHARCLAALYKKCSTVEKSNEEIGSHCDSECSAESLAFAQLVQYMQEVKNDSATAPVFKLCELTKNTTTGYSKLV